MPDLGTILNMRYLPTSFIFGFLTLVLLLPASAMAGENSLMHCFAFTEIEEASAADWQAFMESTNELPSKIDGLESVWVGKLRRPLRQYGRNQEEPSMRQWGVCMEMTGEEALQAYATHEAHTKWVEVYSKVRVAGTTTFDILGQ